MSFKSQSHQCNLHMVGIPQQADNIRWNISSARRLSVETERALWIPPFPFCIADKPLPFIVKCVRLRSILCSVQTILTNYKNVGSIFHRKK